VIFLSCLCFGCSDLVSSSPAGQKADADNFDHCESYSDIAFHMMKARQAGVSMEEQMRIADEMSAKANMDNGIFRAMVIDAYQGSRYSSKSVQYKVMEDFRDKWYLACVEDAMRKK
jgi:hypothetical protein